MNKVSDAPLLQRWRTTARLSLFGALALAALGGATLHVLEQKGLEAEDALRSSRVSYQRAATGLRWLQRDVHRKPVLELGADDLGVRIVDTVSRLAQQGKVVDWRIEGIDNTTADNTGSVQLVVDLMSSHGAAFLELLDRLRLAAGARPVMVSACAMHRQRDDRVDARAALVTRCTLEWPWWADT